MNDINRFDDCITMSQTDPMPEQESALNTYRIIFSRSNGTLGQDHFTSSSRREAMRDFYECYRHDQYTIISCRSI